MSEATRRVSETTRREWDEACALLGIEADGSKTKPNIYDTEMDRETLRRHYRKQSLRLHPDKNPAPDAAEQFQRMRDAYLWLDSMIAFGKRHDHDDVNVSATAGSNGLSAALAKRIWSWLAEVCETKMHDQLVRWIDRFDKDTLVRVHELLSIAVASNVVSSPNIHSVLIHIRTLLASTLHAKTKESQDTQDVQVVLRPTLTDLLQDHVYRLRIPSTHSDDDRVFLVPLWVDEVVYDLGDGRDLIVTCVPDLPEHVTLDEHQNVHIVHTVRIGDVWGQTHLDVLGDLGCFACLRSRELSCREPSVGWVRVDQLRLSPTPQTVLVSNHGVPIAASGGKKSSGAEVYKVGRRGSVYAHIVLIL